jgi:tetratricopeptide (TPR) repeat protein
MFELKRLSMGAIPAALAQAERYRLINEPVEAESICLDILRVDPAHQEALVTLVLALTDQFPNGPAARAMAAAEQALLELRDDYKRLYYSGIIRERRGKAELHSGRPGSHRSVHEWLREAMSCYEQAEAIRPEGNDEAILRWNTCARILMDLPKTEPDIPEFHSVQSE